MQSILGKLLWVSKAVRFSRVFVSRIIAEVRKLKSQSDKVILSHEIKKDFLWWDTYLKEFSGVEFIPNLVSSTNVFGDACVDGGGAWNEDAHKYFSFPFPRYMCSADTPIHIKEFIIVILIVWQWGSNWTGRKVRIFCDNDAVCDTCVFQKPKDIKLQQLLREFLFWTCKYNFFPIVEKIGTKENCIADFLSRVHVQSENDIYFESLDYPRQKRLSVPSGLLSFKAEW